MSDTTRVTFNELQELYLSFLQNNTHLILEYGAKPLHTEDYLLPWLDFITENEEIWFKNIVAYQYFFTIDLLNEPPFQKRIVVSEQGYLIADLKTE